MTQISNERLAEMLSEVEIDQDNAVADAEADQNPQLAIDAVGEFDLAEMRSLITELQALRASSGVEELRVSLDGEKLRKAVDFMLGPSAEGEEYTDATLWVGYAENDEKQKVYGLHLSNSEYPEEGCLTLAELPSPLPTASGVEVKGQPVAWQYQFEPGLPWHTVDYEDMLPKTSSFPDLQFRPLYASPLPTVEVTEGEAPMIMRMVAVGNALAGWMDMSNPGAKTDWAKWRDTSAEALKLATAALSQNKGE